MANHLYLQPVGGHSPSLLWVYSSTHTYTTKSSHIHTHTVRKKIGWVLLQISSVYLFNPLQTTREATSFLIWHMGTKPSSHALMHPPTSTDTLASVINKRYMRTFCLPRFEDPDKQVLGRESLCVEKNKRKTALFSRRFSQAFISWVTDYKMPKNCTLLLYFLYRTRLLTWFA